MPDRLVLASGSPRRAELLAAAGYAFAVDPADVDESGRDGESPEAYVVRVAHDKARAVAGRRRDPGELVLGADTTVVAHGEILAKPADESDAVRMLQLLAGAVHDVFTGVALISGDRERTAVVGTRVRLLPLTPEDIHWYVGTGEPMGKAGAYAIQGRAARFVDWIEGSWSNVVGLPIATVHGMISEFQKVYSLGGDFPRKPL
jgi:septum formation protein